MTIRNSSSRCTKKHYFAFIILSHPRTYLTAPARFFSGLKHVDCYMNELLAKPLEILQMIMNDDDVQIYLMWEHNLSNEPIS